MKKKTLLIGSILALTILSTLVIGLVLLTPKRTIEVYSPLRGLGVLNISLITYSSNYNCYPPNLKALGPPPKGVAPSADAAQYIDEDLASGAMAGYRYTYRPFSSKAKGPLDKFNINADPLEGCLKNCRHYLLDEDGVIHVEANSPATAKSPKLD